MKISVIITSYKEPETIRKAISQVLDNNKDLKKDMELLVVAPDSKTIDAAKKELCKHVGFSTSVIKDLAKGKPAAMNLAVSKAKGEILVFTDGDMHLGDSAIREVLKPFKNSEVGGVSGHPISLDNRNYAFGYYSHLFCEAAHIKRKENKFVAMSGYLYAVKKLVGLFPVPEEVRAEDAYISRRIIELGYKIAYAPNALAYVHFPGHFRDWISQKLRSLGGNVQITSKEVDPLEDRPHMKKNPSKRSIFQDLRMFLFPLSYAKTKKEYLYSILLYPLRLYLWIRIYIQHITKSYSKGAWKRIESSKG